MRVGGFFVFAAMKPNVYRRMGFCLIWMGGYHIGKKQEFGLFGSGVGEGLVFL
jgi:hypothetical protein